MRSIAVVGCIVGLSLALAGPASGEVVAQLRGGPESPPAVSGPRLAGDRVVWSEVNSGHAATISAAAITGGPAKRLVTLPVPTASPPALAGIHRAVSVLASPQALVYQAGATAVDNAKYADARLLYNVLDAGPLDGPYSPLGDVCVNHLSFVGIGPMALDDTRVLSASVCQRTISLRDLSDPSQTGMGSVVHPADNHGITDVRLAGNFAAYSTVGSTQSTPTRYYDEIDVIDLRDGSSRVSWRSADNAGQLLSWDLRRTAPSLSLRPRAMAPRSVP